MKKEKAKKFFVDFDKAMSDNETFFALWNKEGKKENTTLIVVPNTVESQAQTAAILEKHIFLGLVGEGDENDKIIADMVTFAVKKAQEEWREAQEQEEDEEIEDCGDCPDMRTCNKEEAISYRKKHHIPRPKKKSNKK